MAENMNQDPSTEFVRVEPISDDRAKQFYTRATAWDMGGTPASDGTERARTLQEAEWDRWITAHDARVKAEAARDVAGTLTSAVEQIQSGPTPNPIDWQTGALATRDMALDCARRFEQEARR